MSVKSTNNQSSLADILLVIAKHFKFLLLITILAVIITIFYIQNNFVPKYTSSAVIFVPAESSSTINTFARQFGFNTGASSNIDLSSSILYPEIVTSRAFAEKLLQKEFFTEKFNQKLPLLAILSYGTGAPTVGLDTLVLRTYKSISSMVKFTKNAPFLLLNVTTGEPQFSKELAEVVLEELDKLQREFKSQKVIEKKKYIEQQIDIAQHELERLEGNLKNFRETNRRVNSSPSLLLIQDRLQRDVEVQQNIFITLKQQYELSKIEVVQKSTLVQVLDNPSIPLAISNPPKLSSYILGGLAGLFLGLFLIFIFEYFSSRNTEEAEKLNAAKNYLTGDFKKLFKKRK